MTPNDQIEAIAALDEPVRRRLYEYVAVSREAVSRDEAAEAVGIGRPLAAFHLDRLADGGLLSVEYRRLSGRTGRGAGRPSKLYRRADRAFAVELPPRSYDLAADLMAETIDSLGPAAIDALDQRARERGTQLAGTVGRSAPTGGTDTPLAVACDALAELGYEPIRDASGDLRLGNCPFHDLAQAHREATCGMNLSMVQGLLDGLDVPGVAARLDPEPGWCCVRVGPAAGASDN
jgi:predicted ArsR family transcriptional regulator